MGGACHNENPMKDIQLVPTTDDHIEFVAAHMNPLDVQEVLASSGSTPLQALEISHDLSDECLTVIVDGVPHAIFGICSDESVPLVGIPWMLSTGEIYTWAGDFYRISQSVVDDWSRQYPLLTNCSDARHHASHRWLTTLGFKVVEYLPTHGEARIPFYRFLKCANPQH
jgi:hypothetical protein